MGPGIDPVVALYCLAFFLLAEEKQNWTELLVLSYEDEKHVVRYCMLLVADAGSGGKIGEEMEKCKGKNREKLGQRVEKGGRGRRAGE